MLLLIESDKYNALKYFQLLELGKDEACARSSGGEERDNTSKFEPGTVRSVISYRDVFS